MDIREWKASAAQLVKNKYVMAVLLLTGLILLMMPWSSERGTESAGKSEAEVSAPAFSVEDEEVRLRKMLEQIDGAGQVSVLLSVKNTARRQLARNEGEVLVINSGAGSQSAVELSYEYPEYLGAVVICSGADSMKVKLNVTEAVRSFTGLASDKIAVFKMK